MIKIYDFPHGARGLRVAWLCEEMGLAHTFVPVGFPPDRSYRALNPFGTVPFLQDGHVSMSESVAMMSYIARNTDQPRPCRRWPTSASLKCPATAFAERIIRNIGAVIIGLTQA